MKPLVLAVALALCAPLPALAAQAKTPAAPAWVARSNTQAQLLLEAQAKFMPEFASSVGLPAYDAKVADLGPDQPARYRATLEDSKRKLQAALATERDANVRQDLQILLHATEESIEGSQLNEALMLPWLDAPQSVFNGINDLLSDQMPAARRAKALDRLKAYVGTAPGSTPFTALARQRYEEKLANPALLQPTKLEVERALSNVDTYIDGIRELFTQYKITGAEPTLARMAEELKAYGEWTRSTVLPKARTDTRLPPQLYAFQLKQFGIGIDPQLLMQRAQVEFMETRMALQQLAPQVAKVNHIAGTDYISVIRALKRGTIPNDKLEAHYRGVIDQIDPIMKRERIVTVPKLPLQMRLGSAAESAASPAPHYLPPPLVGNTGQQGQFVLPVGNPSADGKDAGSQYDDFNFAAAAWTLSAHEGRPGHDLQFAAMVERGLSLARTLFAFNSVNVEGWALYAEAEMVPYEPAEGQMIALQFRLLRAARAMLDPMLNLGLIDRERARQVLEDDVGLSPAMARQELDRYTFNAPGQAGSYFYGYSRILELRVQTELTLGNKFDRQAFNDFLLDQGLLPPDELAEAVRTQFVPKFAAAK
ncbi:DUF885 domain-containing protein [Pseudoxanthomonas sp. GM95]|uniref:DUF885 domain-containing protein n=1 Tax=Pseudoxanthomonas sp. GM95 TaxID=1881043 RepID=UPI000B808551|nr:DUF885 domain-containing protein [Pseudoxanthomonas sp. GM95]